MKKNLKKPITKIWFIKRVFWYFKCFKKIRKIADRAVSIANLLQFAHVGRYSTIIINMIYYAYEKTLDKIKEYFSSNFEVLAATIIL